MAELTVESVRKETEIALAEFLRAEDASCEKLYEAMRYSALGGGKRVRAFLAYAFFFACGGTDVEKIKPYAASVEMVHAASLIHDDLPAMDDDDMRRGKPSNHKVFGEAQAIIAGDGLFIKAFEVISSNPFCTPSQNARAVSLLAKAAGPDGMCGGQMIDMEYEGRGIDIGLLYKLDLFKTSCLISAACALGCIAAESDRTLLDAACEYGRELGIAFQIRDDILDIEGETAKLGKTAGKDVSAQKSTYPSLLGLDGAKKACADATENAVRALNAFGGSTYTRMLGEFARALAKREN